MSTDVFFFFNDTATTEIYTLSLHDALPISVPAERVVVARGVAAHGHRLGVRGRRVARGARSEEHTSELQSRQYLVCRLLLEKKKNRLPVLDRQCRPVLVPVSLADPHLFPAR